MHTDWDPVSVLPVPTFYIWCQSINKNIATVSPGVTVDTCTVNAHQSALRGFECVHILYLGLVKLLLLLKDKIPPWLLFSCIFQIFLILQKCLWVNIIQNNTNNNNNLKVVLFNAFLTVQWRAGVFYPHTQCTALTVGIWFAWNIKPTLLPASSSRYWHWYWHTLFCM